MKEMENKSAGENMANENKVKETADAISKDILAQSAGDSNPEPDKDGGSDSDKDARKERKAEKKSESKRRFKASFSSRKFKGGAYATVLSVVVIIVLLFVNLIAGQLNLNIDVTSQAQYTISDETRDLMADLQEDITIYYLVQPGNEIELFTELVDRYEGLSSHITVDYVDPVQYPGFASEYTSETISQNSIIVVNDATNRAKYVDYYDMIIQEIDYTTYSLQVTGTDVEGQITSAIQYVTNEDLPIVYQVTGHGETEIGSTLQSSMDKENITLNTLNTLTEESIPEDCDILLINGPTQDLMEAEVTMIEEYLADGGNAIIFAGYGTADLTNFNSLLNSYRVGIVDGVVLEGSTNNYMGNYPNMVVPNVESHDITDAFMDSKYVLMVNASGLEILDGGRTSIEVTSLLETSEDAYSKIVEELTTLTKEEGDIDGPFSLGVYVTEEYDGVETKVAVFASPTLIADSYAGMDTLGNLDLFLNTVNTITEQENTLSIRTVSLAVDTITMTAAQVNMWAAIYIVIIPAVIIIAGIVVTVRRRKK